jgi:Cu/Ag efflux protein CusF
MKKWIGTIAAAAMGFGLSASAWACNTSNGEVQQVNADARTVAMTKSAGGSCCDEGTTDTKANQMVFKIKKDTKILINGKEASLADLKTGDKVKVDYEQLDDVLKISVTRDS